MVVVVFVMIVVVLVVVVVVVVVLVVVDVVVVVMRIMVVVAVVGVVLIVAGGKLSLFRVVVCELWWFIRSIASVSSTSKTNCIDFFMCR